MSRPQLNAFLHNLPWQKSVSLTGIPEGYDAYVLGRVAITSKKPLAIIVDDLKDLNCLEKFFKIFYPNLPCIVFPPWDCIPYDRVSPSSYISSKRTQMLLELKALNEREDIGWVFIGTKEVLIQKVPNPECLVNTNFKIKVGDHFTRDKLTTFFEAQGYRRVDTVYEPGDYALRGGLIDVYPPDVKNPIRLDFFDSELENIKVFDPRTQRSISELKSLKFCSMSETPFTEREIENFRKNYRENFGSLALKDPRAQSVLSGKYVSGLEHLQPLFYDKMSLISDYFPKNIQWVVKEESLVKDIKKFSKEIEDNYKQRTLSESDTSYKVLNPSKLYMCFETWEKWWEQIDKWVIKQGNYSTDLKSGCYNMGGLEGYNFSKERLMQGKNEEKKTLYHYVLDYIKEKQSEKKSCLLLTNSKGQEVRIVDALKDIDKSLTVSSFNPEYKANKKILTLVEDLENGFVGEDIFCITDQDILGVRRKRHASTKGKSSPEELLAELSSFSEKDYVVHEQYGVGIYQGLQTLSVQGNIHDFIEIVYAKGDKLLVPVEHLDAITRYKGSDASVSLDQMGSSAWQIKRARVKKKLMDIADKLMKVAADRHLKRVDVWEPIEEFYEEFCDNFPYELTVDQKQAEKDVLEDFSRGILMDRLVCGDVGFGKTEIALRAAYIATSYKKQVCVIVPTTLLCRQHYKTFLNRFKGFNVKVSELSRLVSLSEAQRIKKQCAKGDVDILICTHAIFGKGTSFKDLGLIILDEEQHFGVKQKESLKKKAPDSHILTLSATPIPRTFQMSLSGIRPMSLIATPPVDRVAIRTFVMPYDSLIVREALLRESFRGGQTFYVCPRLEDLDVLSRQLKELVPELKVAIAHGQQKGEHLEKVMQGFCDGEYDILLSTNIVESGIDIPTANTIVIHRSDMFGLAQLYQLRGRIGRGKTRGYCYLTLTPGKKITTSAKKRLKVMQSLDSLGAGFSIASHDMDIRGAGNLVGEAQAGHIKEVGVELYQQMLKEAVSSVKNSSKEVLEEEDTQLLSQINLGIDAYIPSSYIEDLDLRLKLYRKLAGCKKIEDLSLLEEEFNDRFGSIPLEVRNVFELMELKILSRQANIEKIEVGSKGALLSFYKNRFSNPQGLIEYINEKKGLLQVRPDHKLMILSPMRDILLRYPIIRKFLKDLINLL